MPPAVGYCRNALHVVRADQVATICCGCQVCCSAHSYTPQEPLDSLRMRQLSTVSTPMISTASTGVEGSPGPLLFPVPLPLREGRRSRRRQRIRRRPAPAGVFIRGLPPAFRERVKVQVEGKPFVHPVRPRPTAWQEWRPDRAPGAFPFPRTFDLSQDVNSPRTQPGRFPERPAVARKPLPRRVLPPTVYPLPRQNQQERRRCHAAGTAQCACA